MSEFMRGPSFWTSWSVRLWPEGLGRRLAPAGGREPPALPTTTRSLPVRPPPLELSWQIPLNPLPRQEDMEFSPLPYRRVELLVNCTKPGCCKSLAPNVAMDFFLKNADHSVSFLPLTAWKCSRLKRQQKQNSTSRKSKPFFFSLYNPNGKKQKKTQIKKSITDLHTTKQNKTHKQNRVHKENHKVVGTKERNRLQILRHPKTWLINYSKCSIWWCRWTSGTKARGEELEKKKLWARDKILSAKPVIQNPSSKTLNSITLFLFCFFVSPFQPWIRLPLGFHPLRLFVRPNVWNNKCWVLWYLASAFGGST